MAIFVMVAGCGDDDPIPATVPTADVPATTDVAADVPQPLDDSADAPDAPQTGDDPGEETAQLSGELSGLATLHEPLADLPVTVAGFDDFVVGAPIGAGTTAEDGSFTVVITPPGETARVLIQVGDIVHATVVLEGGSAAGVVVTGLTSLALDLAQRYRIDDMPADEALTLATDRLNDHLQRPDAPNAVSAQPKIGQLGTSQTLSGLFHLGVRGLANASGETDAAIIGVLRTDLGDGLFDGLVSGELLAAPGGYVLGPDTTRYALAEATWSVLSVPGAPAVDLVGLAAKDGYLWDISTDDGPLYPPDAAPTAFEANPPLLKFSAATPPDGSFHNTAFTVGLTTKNAISVDLRVNTAPVLGEQVVIDPAEHLDGPVLVEAKAVSESGTVVSIERTFFIDTTGPKLNVVGELPQWVGADAAVQAVTVLVQDDGGVGESVLQVLDGQTDGDPSDLGDGLWTVQMSLTEPVNTLTVAAFDELDNGSSPLSVSISKDGDLPVVTPDPFSEGAADGVYWIAEGTTEFTFAGTGTDATSGIGNVTLTCGDDVFNAELYEVEDDDTSVTWSVTLTDISATSTSCQVGALDLGGNEATVSDVAVKVDAAGPTLAVISPKNGQWVGSDETLPLSGTISDTQSGVQHVWSNEVGMTLPTIEDDQLNMKFINPLEHGPLNFIVSAKDFVGNVTEVPVNILVDVIAPTAGIVLGEDAVFELDGTTWVGSASVTAACTGEDADQPVVTACLTVDDGAEQCAETQSTLDVALTGQHTLACTVSDGLGNEQSTVVTLAADLTPPELEVQGPAHASVLNTDTVAVFGTVSDAVGVGTVTVAVGDAGAVTAAIEDDGSWTADAPLENGANNLTIKASDKVGNVVTVELTVTYDADPPAVQWLETTYLDEAGMVVEQDGALLIYKGGSPLPIGPSCGDACVVRKLANRVIWLIGSQAAIEQANLPAFRFQLSDDNPPADGWAPVVTFIGGPDFKDPVAPELPVDLDGIVQTAFSYDTVVGDPSKGIVWKNENVPTAVQVTVADAAGNVTTQTYPFTVELLSPPLLIQEAVIGASGYPDLDDYELDAVDMHVPFSDLAQAAEYGGTHLTTLQVKNPYPWFPMRAKATTGEVIMLAKVRRPYLAEQSQSICQGATIEVCDIDTCSYEWPDGPSYADGCFAPQTATDADVVSKDSASIKTAIKTSQNDPVDTLEDGAVGMPAWSVHHYALLGQLTDALCALDGPHTIAWTRPAQTEPVTLPPLPTTTDVYTWNDDGQCQTSALDDGKRKCILGGYCASLKSRADYLSPPIVRSVTIQSAPGAPMLQVVGEPMEPGPVAPRVNSWAGAYIYTSTSGIAGALPTKRYAPFD